MTSPRQYPWPGRGKRLTDPPLRVAVAAMVSPKETFDLYRQLLAYLGHKSGKDLEFVQRKTYGEIDELLRKGEIDLAFICSGPYVAGRGKFGFESLAVPEVHGSHFYRSYLIVNKDSPYRRLEELKGHTFAFTDPDSNTGKLVPTYWLAEITSDRKPFLAALSILTAMIIPSWRWPGTWWTAPRWTA